MGIEPSKGFKTIERFFDLKYRDLLKNPQQIENLVRDCYKTSDLGGKKSIAQIPLEEVLTQIKNGNLI